jgi:glycosyltransferase involved in cell wall biosynthesis
MPRAKVTVLSNGVPHAKPGRITLRDELSLTRDDRLIVAVGNLYPVKGHVHAIDALARLMGRHPSVHLAICGRGELEGALLARAREHGLEHRVHVLGLRSDVPAVLAAADLFVMPSLSEGLPLALLEAMFAGLAIVATDVGQVRVALADGTAGVLVEPGNAAALATALDRLLGSPAEARRLGALAALRAAGEYDLSRMVQRYAGVYTDAMRGRRSPIDMRRRQAAISGDA